MESLFPGRDPRAGTDAKLDALLGEALHSQWPAPGSRPQPEPPTVYLRIAHTPIPPLLKAYWALCALLLALIQMGCDANRLAPQASASSVAKNTSTHPMANQREDSEPSLVKVEPAFPPAKSMTGVREDEPAIEVTGPVPADPFSDWAPRAVLEKLPAPRAQLGSLPVRQ